MTSQALLTILMLLLSAIGLISVIEFIDAGASSRRASVTISTLVVVLVVVAWVRLLWSKP